MHPNSMKKPTNERQSMPEPINTGFKLTELFKGQFDLWLFSWLLGIATVLSTLGLLMLSGWFLTAAAFAGMVALGSHSFNYLVPSAIIRGFAMVRTAGRYGELMVSHHAVFGLLQTLRVRFFNQFSRLLPAELPTTLRSAHTMHRLTYDIDTLDEYPLRVVSPWLIATVVVLIMALMIKILLPLSTMWLTLIIGVLMMACWVVPAWASYRGIRKAQQQHSLAEQRRVKLLEPLSALTHLLIWQRWSSELAKFFDIDQAYYHTLRQAQTTRGITMLVIQWLFAIIVVSVLWVLLHTYHDAAMLDIPMILAVILGLLGLMEIILPLAQNYLALGNSVAAKQRLNELLNADNTSKGQLDTSDTREKLDRPLLIQALKVPSHLVLTMQPSLTLAIKDLSAKLPNAIVGFSHFDACVKQGRPLLVTGASGAGKSTLLQVLSNEITTYSGSIKLNNYDWHTINWYDQPYPQLGYLGQQIDIFDQTLAQNLRLGKADATNDELWTVLDKVGLTSWAQAQPHQLATRLGEYGMAISGGQARRIALARLLLTPKQVLLLDEPFAGLDKDTREYIWQQLVEHQQQGVLIVVTHQLWQQHEAVDIITLPEPHYIA